MVTYKSLKTKEKSTWIILKVVTVTFKSFSVQSLSQLKWGFTKVVVTRAGRLREWSKGEI